MINNTSLFPSSLSQPHLEGKLLGSNVSSWAAICYDVKSTRYKS